MAKPSGSRKTVNAANIEALGAPALAALLMELGDRQPSLKRRLRMELAARVGPGDLALEIDKRLETHLSGRGRVSWRKRPDLIADLNVLRAMIAGRLGALDVELALARMWVFMRLVQPLSGRATDPKGELDAVFLAAAQDLGGLAARSSQLPMQIARSFGDAILADSGRRWSDWMRAALPGLSAQTASELLAILENQTHLWTPKLSWIARMLADAAGDADAFVRAIPEALRATPAAGAESARRLLDSGRAEEALGALQASDPRVERGKLFGRREAKGQITDYGWESAYIEALDVTGHGDEAQAARWTSFEHTLSAGRLRDFVKRLADFDDVEAIDRGTALALSHREFGPALTFLMEWPALPEAAKLVVVRRGEIDGALPDLIAWAERLENRYPLAAVLLMRAKALNTLRGEDGDLAAIESQLEDIRSLSAGIAGPDGVPAHDEFLREVARRRRR